MINKIKNAIRKCRSEFEKAEMWKRFLFIALSPYCFDSDILDYKIPVGHITYNPNPIVCCGNR